MAGAGDLRMTGLTHIILVNWNGGSDTVECLESLLRLKGEFTVTVCDNGSVDGSIERIIKWADGPDPGSKWSPLADRLGAVRLRSPTYRILAADDTAGPTDDLPFLTVLKNRGQPGVRRREQRRDPAGPRRSALQLRLAAQ